MRWFTRTSKKRYTQEQWDELVDVCGEAVEKSYLEGFENGREEGYTMGKADGINIAKEAAKKAIQRRNQHGQETKPSNN